MLELQGPGGGARVEPGLASNGPPARVSTRRRLLTFAVVAAISLVPIALVRYPPILDLAQQTAQIPLLRAALGDQAELYRVQWFAPNKLSYPLLALGWFAGGPENAARIGLALCLVAALGAVHLLAASFERPVANAVLASIFVWTAAFYGGFLNFFLGGIGLAFWMREVAGTARPDSPSKVYFRASAAALLLYWSHLTWLAAALGLLLIFAIRRTQVRSRFGTLLAALSPPLLAAWSWNVSTVDWQVVRRVIYATPISHRVLAVQDWGSQLLGGLRGPAELAVVVAVGFWCFMAWLSSSRSGTSELNRDLVLAAAAFFGAAMLLPDYVDEGMLFAQRWASFGAICLVLAVPLPSRARTNALAISLLSLFVAITSLRWRDFDRTTMAGFDRCRTAIGDHTRVLYLDFERNHPSFLINPTFQMAAYARLDRPVELAFSFAEHRTSLVVFSQLPRPIGWQRFLEHFPERATAADLSQFDLVLVHATGETVERVETRLQLGNRLASEGSWALLRVRGDDAAFIGPGESQVRLAPGSADASTWLR